MTNSTPAFMLAIIERDRAALEALLSGDRSGARSEADRASARAREAWRSRAGSPRAASAVFTLRLGQREFTELHTQAIARSLPPSVLARNLIREGLIRQGLPARASDPSRRPTHELAALAERVRSAARPTLASTDADRGRARAAG